MHLPTASLPPAPKSASVQVGPQRIRQLSMAASTHCSISVLLSLALGKWVSFRSRLSYIASTFCQLCRNGRHTSKSPSLLGVQRCVSMGNYSRRGQLFWKNVTSGAPSSRDGPPTFNRSSWDACNMRRVEARVLACCDNLLLVLLP